MTDKILSRTEKVASVTDKEMSTAKMQNSENENGQKRTSLVGFGTFASLQYAPLSASPPNRGKATQQFKMIL
jgi:hypothetical protein